MKKLLVMVIALAANYGFADTFKLNSDSTQIEWIGTKVTGEHRGFIKVKEGSQIEVKENLISKGVITVDINSMTVTDIEDPEYVAKFLSHMKSPDFFNTEKYPEAKLEITKSKKAKDGLAVEGKMTILGKTQPVKFTTTSFTTTNGTLSSEAVLKLDRTKFGLKYGSGQFFKNLGDKMIHDDFTLNIKLQATKI